MNPYSYCIPPLFIPLPNGFSDLRNLQNDTRVALVKFFNSESPLIAKNATMLKLMSESNLRAVKTYESISILYFTIFVPPPVKSHFWIYDQTSVSKMDSASLKLPETIPRLRNAHKWKVQKFLPKILFKTNEPRKKNHKFAYAVCKGWG